MRTLAPGLLTSNQRLGWISSIVSTCSPGRRQNFGKHSQLCSQSLRPNGLPPSLQIEAGHMEIEDSVEFDVRFEVSETLNSFAEAARQKGLELNKLVQDSVPGQLTGDPNRLRQVLNNLLSNAIKFTKQGGILLCIQVGDSISCDEVNTADVQSKEPAVRWIDFADLETPRMQAGVSSTAEEVSATRKRSQQNFERVKQTGNNRLRLVISCADTGIGISSAAQSRLFTPFLQGDAATSRQYGGTGIGLSISQKLVRLMGGQVSVASREGVGSTFQFDVRVGIVRTQNRDGGLEGVCATVLER